MEFDAMMVNRCEKLQAPSYLNLSLSIFIVFGILLSYLPQHYRIISRRTSEGISPYFILLGTISGTCAFANILVLPASRTDVACCGQVSTFECFAGMLGIAQVGVQWSCFFAILLLFLIFFPRDEGLPTNLNKERPTWRTALIIAFACLAHIVLTIFISAWLIWSKPDYLLAWANTLGVMAAGLAAIQYFPQIWTTYNLEHVGSLSIPMMCIQTPGSFVWAASLAARLGMAGWSTWGVYLVTGCLQGCLLAMGIYLEMQARKARGMGSPGSQHRTPAEVDLFHGHVETDDEGHPVVENVRRPEVNRRTQSERTPLLTSISGTGVGKSQKAVR